MSRISLASLFVLPLALAACAGTGMGSSAARGGASMDRESIGDATPRIPYSAAVRAGDFYFMSGKIGASGQTRAMTEGRTAAEVRNIMESFRTLFAEIGIDFDDVVMATVYLTDLDDYQDMNRVYGEYFPSAAPARETVVVSELVADAAVEISFIAIRR